LEALVQDHDSEKRLVRALSFVLVQEFIEALSDLFEVTLGVRKWKHVETGALHVQLSLALHEVVTSLLGFVAGELVVNKDELVVVDGLAAEDWHHLEESLTGEQVLVSTFFVDKFRSSKLSALKNLRTGVNGDVPLCPLGHLEELVDHTRNSGELLLGVLLDFVEEGSHGSAVVSNGIWDSIDQAEFGRKTDLSSLGHHDKHGLSLVRDLHVVSSEEILGDTDFLSVLKIEVGVARTKIELDVLDNVSPLGTVVGDHTSSGELLTHCFLETWKSFFHVSLKLHVNDVIIELVDVVQDGLGGHESSAAINDQTAAGLVLVGGGLETAPNLHVQLFDVNGRGGIEETWALSELQETSLTHGLLDNDVQDLAHGLAVLTVGVVEVGGVNAVFSLEVDLEGDLVAHQLRFDDVALIELLGGPDVETGVDVSSNQHLDSCLLAFNDFANFERSEIVGRNVGIFRLLTLEHVQGVLIDLRSVLTNLHSELIGIELNLLHLGLFWVD
jgi:hypothetical protein